jgi:hypothetical protein
MSPVPSPRELGLVATFEMIAAPAGKTFFYRKEHKRVIDARVLDSARLHDVRGPLIYGVTDHRGDLRYVGKWVSLTPLYARWFRREHVHHQASSRGFYLDELDAGRGPLTVWSSSAVELRDRIALARGLTNVALVDAVEALWIRRWREQLWNRKLPAVPPGFSDGEYWKAR